MKKILLFTAVVLLASCSQSDPNEWETPTTKAAVSGQDETNFADEASATADLRREAPAFASIGEPGGGGTIQSFGSLDWFPSGSYNTAQPVTVQVPSGIRGVNINFSCGSIYAWHVQITGNGISQQVYLNDKYVSCTLQYEWGGDWGFTMKLERNSFPSGYTPPDQDIRYAIPYSINPIN